MGDEIDRGFGPRVDLFAKIPLNQIAKTLLTLDGFDWKHLPLLERKSATYRRNRHVIALRQPPPQGRVSGEHLDLNAVSVAPCELTGVTIKDVMEMDRRT